MLRHAAGLCVAMMLGGCGSGAPTRPAPFTPSSPYARVSTDVPVTDVDPMRVRGRATTIDWMRVSTAHGAAYAGGSVVVDQILRSDSVDSFGVEVRLANRSAEVFNGEYRILFYTEAGLRILGLNDAWEKFSIAAADYRTLSSESRLGGAVGFRVYVRKVGETTEGEPEGGGAEGDLEDLLRELNRG